MHKFSLIVFCLGVVANGAKLPNGRILGGEDIDITEVPYLVAVEQYGFQFCTGAIISENYVLTGSHCLIELGDWDISIRTGTTIRQNGGTVINVKNIINHPKYSYRGYDYDACILELEAPIEFNDKSQKIPIAAISPETGELCRVSGWGVTEETGKPSAVLQTIEIPIADHQDCKVAYLDYALFVSDRMICAGLTDKDSCGSDGGGPLVYNDEIAGIVSWGVGCGREGLPRVYTNVVHPDIRDFIRNTTGI